MRDRFHTFVRRSVLRTGTGFCVHLLRPNAGAVCVMSKGRTTDTCIMHPLAPEIDAVRILENPSPALLGLE